MPLARPQQPEQAAGHRAERDLRVGDGEAPGGLPGPDVAQGAWRQPAGRVQGLQAGAGQEPGDIGVRPAQPPGDPQRDGEDLRRVADVRTGLVDHLPPLFQQLSGRGPEQLLLAVEVVVEGPEADVGLFGDLGDARALASALGDQPHRGIDQGLPGPGLTPVQPAGSRHPAGRCHLRHRCPPISPTQRRPPAARSAAAARGSAAGRRIRCGRPGRAHRCFGWPATVVSSGQAAVFSFSVTAERMLFRVRRSSMPCTSAQAP